METDQQRAEILRRVMKAVRHRSGRRPFDQTRDADGGFQIVVALTDDTIERTAQTVAAAGGTASVVVERDGLLLVLSWAPDLDTPLKGMGSVQRVHPHCEMGLLIELLESQVDRSVAFRIEMPTGNVQVRDREEITVPA